jgi:putative transposase
MSQGLKRIVGRGDLHFITFCCYQRRRFLATARARNIALQVLREVRSRYDFALIGYVFMPDHVHLLVSEPPAVPTAVMQVFKQRVSRRMRARKRRAPAQLWLRFDDAEDQQRRFWQRRYFDFNVYSTKKVIEKLHYMHANPVKEKLVHHPGDWPWSSWCHYYGRHALLVMDAWERCNSADSHRLTRFTKATKEPTLCKERKG